MMSLGDVNQEADYIGKFLFYVSQITSRFARVYHGSQHFQILYQVVCHQRYSVSGLTGQDGDTRDTLACATVGLRREQFVPYVIRLKDFT